MNSFFWRKELDEKVIHPCYFFYGEELFLAEEFIEELKQALISPEDQDYNIEKCNLEDQPWMEILDLARSIPFFFSSWRFIVVNIPVGKGERPSSLQENVVCELLSHDGPSAIPHTRCSTGSRGQTRLLRQRMPGQTTVRGCATP